MRILITGTTGESMPPPYGGVPKLILTSARFWRESGNEVALTFVHRPKNADDIGANATYFFEFSHKPNKLSKLFFLIRYFLTNPALYFELFKSHYKISPRVSSELILYSAYGVFLDGIYTEFKPDVILSEAALIKTYMAAVVANRRGIPIVYDVYAEVRELNMGENRYLSENQRKVYWTTFLNKASLIVGLDNCAVEMKAYVPREKLKIFWDTCDYKFFSEPRKETREELREYFKLPAKTFLVGAVGSFELRKGNDHLIMAVGRLAKAGHDVGVVVCGGGDPQKWRDLAKEEGLEDRLYIYQRLSQEDLAKLHRCMDIYTNLSNTQRSCSLDLALMEAMASGLPVVVYDTGALTKAAPEGKNGYVVPMNEIDTVSEKLLEASRLTHEQRVAMGKISAEIAAGCDFGITTSIKLEWFNDVVGARTNKQS